MAAAKRGYMDHFLTPGDSFFEVTRGRPYQLPPEARRRAGLTPETSRLEVVPDEEARTQPFRLTAQGKRLLERAVPAWEKAQSQATEFLGEDGIALLGKAASKLGMPQARP